MISSSFLVHCILVVLETEPFHVFTLDLSSQETNEEDREQDAGKFFFTFCSGTSILFNGPF